MEQAGNALGRRSLDPCAAFLMLLVGVVNAPYLAANVVPVHDTFYNFANFEVFYSRFFHARDLVHWYPYGTYGHPAALFQVISLSPLDYLFGLFGALLGARDPLVLFNLASIAEHGVFVLSIYVLARRLFSARATALVLGVAACGTVVWHVQQWFELRFFYLLPLVLYFAVTFLEQRSPARLWMAGITCVAWGLGNVPYFAPLWALVLLTVLAPSVLAFRWRGSRAFAPTPVNLLLFAVLCAGAASYAYAGLHSLDFVAMYEDGRDVVTGRANLETFRAWGGNADLLTVARSFLSAWPPHLPVGRGADNSVYLGLLPLVGFGLALARERARMFVGLVAAAGVLVWLSLGGLFAAAVYYLPTMSAYRHVGLVYGLVKTLVLIAAGYGIERLWEMWPRLPRNPFLWMAGAAFAIEAIGLALRLPIRVAHPEGAELWPVLLSVRLALYLGLGAASLSFGRSLKAGMLAALVLDLGIYQWASYQEVVRLAPEAPARFEGIRVRGWGYQPQRLATSTLLPPGEETRQTQQAFGLAKDLGPSRAYWVTYNLARFDPCRAEYWTDTRPFGVDALLELETELGLNFDDILGCSAPKLRLVSDALLVESGPAARRAFLKEVERDRPWRDVIRVASGGRPSASQGSTLDGSDAGTVSVTSFSPDELVAETHVAGSTGAWLVYADAADPGWRASIDGLEIPIAEANLAFKAVWVPSGEHVVRFSFGDGLGRLASWSLAVFGAAYGLALLVGLGLCLAGARPRGGDAMRVEGGATVR